MDDQQPSDSTKKRILIVEDNKVLSDIYVQRLQLEGFDTRLVANGQEAPTVATEYQPDLVLLDLMLPGMNGLDVLEALRSSEITKGTKIFVFSALAEERLIRERDRERDSIMKAGADEYLVKSRDLFNDVIDKIKSALGVPS